MNRIIAIEGISGSGKSTLINDIMHFDNSWKLVNELFEEFNPLKDFPKFETKTKAAIKTNEWFLNQEIERCKLAKIYSNKNNVVADRWFYSVLAVSYARAKINNTQDQESLYISINKKINDGVLYTPEIYILSVPLDVALERLNKRYNNDKDLLNKLGMTQENLKHQNDFYNKLVTDLSFKYLDGTKDIYSLVKNII